MATITLTIPNDKVQRVTDAMQAAHPVPKDEVTGQPLFTANEWAKQVLIRFIVDMVHTHEKAEARRALNIVADNELVT